MKPGLTFFADDMETRVEYLRASGYELKHDAPFAGGVTLTAPEGTPLYLYPGTDYPDASDYQ